MLICTQRAEEVRVAVPSPSAHAITPPGPCSFELGNPQWTPQPPLASAYDEGTSSQLSDGVLCLAVCVFES